MSGVQIGDPLIIVEQDEDPFFKNWYIDLEIGDDDNRILPGAEGLRPGEAAVDLVSRLRTSELDHRCEMLHIPEGTDLAIVPVAETCSSPRTTDDGLDSDWAVLGVFPLFDLAHMCLTWGCSESVPAPRETTKNSFLTSYSIDQRFALKAWLELKG